MEEGDGEGGIAQSYFDMASPCKVAIQSTEVVEDCGIILKISPKNIPVEPLLCTDLWVQLRCRKIPPSK